MQVLFKTGNIIMPTSFNADWCGFANKVVFSVMAEVVGKVDTGKFEVLFMYNGKAYHVADCTYGNGGWLVNCFIDTNNECINMTEVELPTKEDVEKIISLKEHNEYADKVMFKEIQWPSSENYKQLLEVL